MPAPTLSDLLGEIHLLEDLNSLPFSQPVLKVEGGEPLTPAEFQALTALTSEYSEKLDRLRVHLDKFREGVELLAPLTTRLSAQIREAAAELEASVAKASSLAPDERAEADAQVAESSEELRSLVALLNTELARDRAA